MRLVATFLGLIFTASPLANANACSVTADFVRSTSFELVQQADAVVIARAVSGVTGEQAWDVGVTFEIEGALKGSPPVAITMRGAILGDTTPSDPNDISVAHPETYFGSCSRRTFQAGGRYILFLRIGVGEDEPTGWYAIRPTFWRGSEDFAGPDSLWASTLRYYIEVQEEADPMIEIERLAARLSELETPDASVLDQKLALDIRDHLSSLSPDKPTAYLIAAYEALERGETPRFSVRGPEANREGGMADARADAIFDVRHPDFDSEAMKLAILRSLVNGEHPDAAPFISHLLAANPTPAELGLGIRFLAKNDQYRRAFELVETDVMRILGGLPDDSASALVNDATRALTGRHWHDEQKRELWRSDPYVLARWPALALSISSDFARRGIEGSVGPVQLLRTGEPRDQPEVTLALARGFDSDVTAWAIAETSRLTPTADWLDEDDPLWLPVQALVVGFGDDVEAALVRAFCTNESGRIIVTSSLASWGDDLDRELLIRFLVTPGLDEEAIDQVRQALVVLIGRTTRVRNGLLDAGEPYDALSLSMRGEPVALFDGPVQPVTCPAA